MARARKKNPVGRWRNYTSVPTDSLEMAIAEILEEYGDVIYEATEEGLTKAAYEMSAALKEATPKGETKLFSKKWKVEGIGKYKLKRFIGNEHTVKGKAAPISLANIFEYSTTRGKPFVKETFEKNASKIARIIVDEIKKEA